MAATGFVDVRDVVTIMIESLMKSNIHNEQFVLVAEKPFLRPLIELFSTPFGKPAPKKKASKCLNGTKHPGWVVEQAVWHQTQVIESHRTIAIHPFQL